MNDDPRHPASPRHGTHRDLCVTLDLATWQKADAIRDRIARDARVNPAAISDTVLVQALIEGAYGAMQKGGRT